jgi:transcriptional regulator with XRE-family HTH domain
MDARSEIREFLTSRRAKLKAADVGLPDYGTRRVPGLRREEVAVLAGVSVPYYTRLERGDLAGASDSVLEALARALQLDDAERAHLFDLAPSNPSGRPRAIDTPSTASAPRYSSCSTRSRAPPPTSATTASTSSAPTRSAAPCS